jgi:glycosyltransferase involved in cell wall biosynthesis
MPREILHVLGTAQDEGTGIARIVTALATGLDPRKYRIHAWFLGGSGPLVTLLEAAGAAVRVIDWSRGARDPLGAWRFWRSFYTHDFALMHQHAGGRSLRHLVRLSSRARIVVHLHGRVAEPQPEVPIPSTLGNVDAIIAASRSVAGQVVPPPSSRVIYTGAALPPTPEPRPFVSPRGPVVGTACRLVPIKGLRNLIEATAMLSEKMPDLRLEIAGSGPSEDELRRHCRELDIAGKVTFLGWQRDLEPAYRRWDVFCLPSLEEGFGLAALEAMASGLPVIATSVGGLPEIVEDGVTGYLVPPSDPEALATNLRILLQDGARRQAMGSAARRRVAEHFSVDRMVRDVEALYASLLTPARAQSPTRR